MSISPVIASSSATANQEKPELERKAEELAKKAAAHFNAVFARGEKVATFVDIAELADGSLRVLEVETEDASTLEKLIQVQVHRENDLFVNSEGYKKAQEIYKNALEKTFSQGNDIP